MNAYAGPNPRDDIERLNEDHADQRRQFFSSPVTFDHDCKQIAMRAERLNWAFGNLRLDRPECFIHLNDLAGIFLEIVASDLAGIRDIAQEVLDTAREGADQAERGEEEATYQRLRAELVEEAFRDRFVKFGYPADEVRQWLEAARADAWRRHQDAPKVGPDRRVRTAEEHREEFGDEDECRLAAEWKIPIADEG